MADHQRAARPRRSPRDRSSSESPVTARRSLLARSDPTNGYAGPLDLLHLQRAVGNRAATALAAAPPINPRGDGRTQFPLLIQRRRIPDGSKVGPLVAVGATDVAEHAVGLGRLVMRTWAAMPPAARKRVTARYVALGGGVPLSTAAVKRMAQAMRTEFPKITLGDPRLINTGARTGTRDRANINRLVANTNRLFNAVLGSGKDKQLRLVFGAPHVAAAKAKYRAAKTQLGVLHAADKIVTDRSGYDAEAFIGGLSNAEQIMVAPGIIDRPNSKESIITLLHESMHAGNSDVSDFGYLGSTGFTELTALEKLTNAAHFEVVPRQIRKATHSYKGVRFVPAGTTVTPVGGGPPVTVPPMTMVEKASRQASEWIRESWALGLNIHNLWVDIYKTPANWTGVSLPGVYSGATARRFKNCMPYWSKVQGLTVHERGGIDPSSGDPSKAPVTQIDIALSEGLVRAMGNAMTLCDTHLDTEANAEKLRKKHMGAYAALAVTGGVMRYQLILSIMTELGSITGTPKRDARVVTAMHKGTTASSWAGVLKTRSPSTF